MQENITSGTEDSFFTMLIYYINDKRTKAYTIIKKIMSSHHDDDFAHPVYINTPQTEQINFLMEFPSPFAIKYGSVPSYHAFHYKIQ